MKYWKTSMLTLDLTSYYLSDINFVYIDGDILLIKQEFDEIVNISDFKINFIISLSSF